MNDVINISINVSKISKDKLFEGKKGKYLNATLIPTPNSEYGDFMIVESISKEERQSGKQGIILGNGKFAAKGKQKPAKPAGNESDQDDIPF